MISVSSDFDSGNITVIKNHGAGEFDLEINKDSAADFFQWFNFRVDGAKGAVLTLRIGNLTASSYPKGWEGYRAAASYDGENWFRVSTNYESGVLTIMHTPDSDTVQFAYFAAYPTSRYRAFVEKQSALGVFEHAVIGETLDGQSIDYFRIGDGPLQYWVIARQHPGESMGSWWMEGFLPALASGDAAARALCEAATVHVIPCMNLDGARRGHLRTNAAGKDLNREWRRASMEKSPEVYLVRQKMRETGVDFFLDVHGDEAIPNNFLDDAMGIPSWNDKHAARFERYCALLLEKSADFQTKDGYPTPPPGGANMDIANNYVADTWGCLSITLEMPFKDANVNPMPDVGWSPERCRTYARAHLEVMAEISSILC